MSESWYSFYLPITDSARAAEALRAALEGAGYTPYDPFPGGTGTPPGLTQWARLFVAPAQDGWVRVLGQPDEALLPGLSVTLGVPLLYSWLDGESGGFVLVQGGTRYDDPAVLEAYRQPSRTPDDLRRALAGERLAGPLDTAQAGSLPPELQQFAQEQGVDSGKASKLVERLGGNLFGRFGDAGHEQAQARAVFAGGGRDIWNSLAGQRVRAIADTLTLPANWCLPEWEAVRDAYQVYRMRQRYPRMAAMAGDREALEVVPDVAAYGPVYFGRA